MTILALTGTPGTGKTSIARELAHRGWRVLAPGDLVDASDVPSEPDPHRATRVVDVDAAGEAVAPRVTAAREAGTDLVLEGHWSHDLALHDVVVLLRCHPGTLRERLRGKGWRDAKVRENVEAELVGVLAHELRGEPAAAEVDTTELTPPQAADRVLEVAADPARAPPPGTVDWIRDAADWLEDASTDFL